jgi:hypothetical protein
MIDRDQWPEADLNEVARELAKHRNHFLALSNPCVEYWFYLHFRDPKSFADGQAVMRDLRRHLPEYSKDNFDLTQLKAGVHKAIERAERQDGDRQALWPKNTGTQVYRLMKELLGEPSQKKR